jgi:hypothetical protein
VLHRSERTRLRTAWSAAHHAVGMIACRGPCRERGQVGVPPWRRAVMARRGVLVPPWKRPGRANRSLCVCVVRDFTWVECARTNRRLKFTGDAQFTGCAWIFHEARANVRPSKTTGGSPGILQLPGLQLPSKRSRCSFHSAISRLPSRAARTPARRTKGSTRRARAALRCSGRRGKRASPTPVRPPLCRTRRIPWSEPRSFGGNRGRPGGLALRAQRAQLLRLPRRQG